VTLGSCSASGGDTTCTLSGSALTPSFTLTSYSLTITYLGSTDSTDFSSPTAGSFPVVPNWLSASVTFGSNTYSLSYLSLNDGSQNAHFAGTWDGGSPFDFNLNFLNGAGCAACTIDYLAANPGTNGSATVQSGEFVVPEPTSLVLLGSVLGLAVILGRRIVA